MVDCEKMVLTRILFAPHEDDAVLSSGGLILQSLEEGINVIVVYMTDGNACYLVSGMDVGKTLEEIARIRKIEAIRCCETLGIPMSNIQFLEKPDQHLKEPEHFNSAFEFIKIILRSYSQVEVFVPVGKNPHPDHQATYEIVTQAVKELEFEKTGLSISIYQYGLHRAVVGKADIKIKLTPDQLKQKIQGYDCHQSQKFILVNEIPAHNDVERFKLVKD